MRKQLQQLILVSFVMFSIFQVFSIVISLTGGEHISSTSFLLHAGILAVAILYVLFVNQRLYKLKDELAIMQELWQDVPFAVVIKKNNVIKFENDNFRQLLISTSQAVGASHCIIDKAITDDNLKKQITQASQKVDIKHIERYTLPLFGGQTGYSAEVAIDVSRLVIASSQREEDYINMLKILVNMFEMKDQFDKGHSQVVSDLAQELGVRLGMSEQDIKVIAKAAILHDIGKIVIPASILNKTEALSHADYESIRRHAEVGADIVKIMPVFSDVAPIIRHHHERYDGKGYPSGLAGKNIPLGSRILAVVDAFDAMTAGRTYRGKKDVDTAIALLENEKWKQFDPEIVDAFIELVYGARHKTEK